MLKELHKGIYEAIGRSDIPLLTCDFEEPKIRPAIKIYIKPKVSRLNANVRLTEYEIMVLYYAKDYRNYYLEHYEVEEIFSELLMSTIELENGVFINLDELEFENDLDLLAVYSKVTIDTYVDSEADDEIMEELSLYMNELHIEV